MMPSRTGQALVARPAEADVRDGGAPARRAVVRWAWRLYRHEWRQQLLVLALITVAVAATILGAGIAVNTPPPSNAGFGTGDHLVTLPGSDPHLAADIAGLKAHFGTIDVIENENFANGTVQGGQLRLQNPDGPYGSPMLALDAGHYPIGAGEVAMTAGLAYTFNLIVGDVWHEAGHALRVVGLVENPQNLLDNFALVASERLVSPSQVTVLFDATPASVASFSFPRGATPVTPEIPNGISPAIVVFVIAIFGLIFIGLVAVAGFTVLAQRRLRSVGMLSSLGATDRNVRLVMVANGAVVGVIGALLGAVIGFAAWIAYAPHLATSADHRVAWTQLPWWLVAAAMVLAVATAIMAARRPARAIAQVSVVAALSGRPAPPKSVHRSAYPGIILLGVGTVFLALSGGPGRGLSAEVPIGLVCTATGLLFLAPVSLALLGLNARRAPAAVRIALRDLSRYRARSGSALAATSFAVLIAMTVTLVATGRYTNVLDYFGPNLEAKELVVYAPGNVPGGGGPSSTLTAKQTAKLDGSVSEIAALLDSHDALVLDATAELALVRSGPVGASNSGTIYVASPALLRHYGISPSAIDPTTMLITSRPGLQGLTGLQLIYGNLQALNPDIHTVMSPKIQTFASLPTDTSDPNLLVTSYLVHKLKLAVSTGAWLIQTPRPLTSLEVNTARQAAAVAGMTIETKNGDPSLAELRNYATVAGILLALGVLAMTVGLIRGEAAGDLRALTAMGANRRTRRTLTSVTAGALGLLGAVLGTAVAYIDSAAFFGGQVSEAMSQVPVLDLVLVLVALPVAAAAGGWLFAGREPSAIARQPLE
jgi:putative ABC transport system permease protein